MRIAIILLFVGLLFCVLRRKCFPMPDKPPEDISAPVVVVSFGDRIGYIANMTTKTFKKLQKRHRGCKITVTWCMNDDGDVVVETPRIDKLTYEYESRLSVILDMGAHDTQEESVGNETTRFCPFLVSTCSSVNPSFFETKMGREHERDICTNEARWPNCCEFLHQCKKEATQ